MSDAFVAALERLSLSLGGALTDLRRLSGGASQETWAFAAGEQPLILRRAPGGVADGPSAQAIGLAAEAAVIEAARAAGAPAPEVVHVCGVEDGLGAAYVMRRIEGETIPRRIFRDEVFAKARQRLAFQCGEALAQIHAAPIDALPALPVQDAPTQLARYEEIYRSFDAPRPAFELAFAELRGQPWSSQRPRLVHGDFRMGNLMIGPDGLRAALDWELAHLGDPAEDLGWLCVPSWRFGAMDRPVGGVGAVEDLLAGYRAAGGDQGVDLAAIRRWTMLGSLKWGIMCLVMFRVYDSGLDRSVERAAIGRRASETELDLMLMLRGKL